MYGAKGDIVVNAPPDKVFSYLADFTRHHDWNGWQGFRLKPTSRGSFGVSSTFEASADLPITEMASSYGGTTSGLKTYTRVETVTEVVPNTRLAFSSSIEPYQTEGNWRVLFMSSRPPMALW